MNAYSYQPGAAEQWDRAGAAALAQSASVVLSNALLFLRSTSEAANLQEALENRDVIGQAKGILMAFRKCDSDTAFAMLREASQHSNRKLRDVASDVIEQGGLPDRG